MKRIKEMNWKTVVYWFFVMSIMNVYIIPKFINPQPITTKRIVIGIIISFLVAFLMGFLTTPKTNDTQQ